MRECMALENVKYGKRRERKQKLQEKWQQKVEESIAKSKIYIYSKCDRKGVLQGGNQ